MTTSIKLTDWLTRNLRLPLLVGAVSTALILALVAIQSIYKGRESQKTALSDVSDLVSFSVKQKNRPLAEVALDTFQWQGKAEWTAICDQGQLQLGTHAPRTACSGGVQGGAGTWFRREIDTLVPGYSEMRVVARVPRFPLPVGTAWSAGLVVLWLFGMLFLVGRIKKKLETRVFSPIALGLPPEVLLKAGSERPIAELIELRAKLDTAEELKVRQAVMKALVEQSQQVAHDIRSPLTALTVIMPTVRGLPAEERELIKQAVDRIQGIAKDLLRANREYTNGPRAVPQQTQAISLTEVLSSIVDEKRLELTMDRPNTEICLEFGEGVGGAQVMGAECVLKRAFSNLLNNAIEAPLNAHTPQRKVKVRVNQDASAEKIGIEVIDNGPGIPNAVINHVGHERGLSIGKPNGSGLGVFQARQAVLAAGGNLRISNRTDCPGVRVEIELPISIDTKLNAAHPTS